MKATYHQYNLQFKRPSGTSRGVMTEKETWFIVIENDGKKGIGECGILRGLSVDDRIDYEEKLQWTCDTIHLGVDLLWEALIDGRIDVVATDHAPHTLEEKKNLYTKAPSGGPLVQHAVVAMFEAYHQGKISIEKIVEKMAHNPAKIFKIEKRGFIKVGFYADLVIVNIGLPWSVKKENILAKCGWSPFEGYTFKSRITHTIVNGQLVYASFKVKNIRAGKRLLFNR